MSKACIWVIVLETINISLLILILASGYQRNKNIDDNWG